MWELSKSFRFEAAHTLERSIDTDASRRINGPSYRAEVTIRREADPATGMAFDFGQFGQVLEAVRGGLDHRFLDEVAGLKKDEIEQLFKTHAVLDKPIEDAGAEF